MTHKPAAHADPAPKHPTLARLISVATGYVGITTFILVAYFSIQATTPTPGELLIDRATGAPLWVWIGAITASVTAAGVIALLGQALVSHDNPPH